MLVDTKVDHSCRKCDWSWNLNPTAKEVKAAELVGVTIDPVCVCLNPMARQKMPDGVYPRLAQIVRDEKTLCGPKGLWWRPITFVPVQHEGERIDRPKRPLGEKQYKKPQHITRRQQYEDATQEQSQPVQSKPRKPYKVG